MTSQIPPVMGQVPPPIPVGYPPIIRRRPGVVLANRFWCAFIAVLHLAVLTFTILELTGVVGPTTSLFEEMLTPKEGPEREALLAQKRQETREIAPVLITVSVVGMGFYGFAFFAPRKKWGWRIGLIAIIASIFPFCVTWVGMLPLIIFWCKPEVKRYFAEGG